MDLAVGTPVTISRHTGESPLQGIVEKLWGAEDGVLELEIRLASTGNVRMVRAVRHDGNLVEIDSQWSRKAGSLLPLTAAMASVTASAILTETDQVEVMIETDPRGDRTITLPVLQDPRPLPSLLQEGDQLELF